MTQQLDLTFNTANTTDKMMSNSTMSFMSNENKSDLSNKFDNFLDNANKNYTKNTKYENKQSLNSNDKKDITSKNQNNNYSSNKNESSTQKVEYSENKVTVKENNNTSKEVIKTSENNNNDDDKQISINETAKMVTDQEIGKNVEIVENAEDINQLLQESILTANMSDVVQMINTDENKSNLKNLVNEFSTENELPVEAIKSGIKFETALNNVDTSNADVELVENNTKDMTVSKEDIISQMYSAEKFAPETKKENFAKNFEIQNENTKSVNISSELKVLSENNNADENINLTIPKQADINTEIVEKTLPETAKNETSINSNEVLVQNNDNSENTSRLNNIDLSKNVELNTKNDKENNIDIDLQKNLEKNIAIKESDKEDKYEDSKVITESKLTNEISQNASNTEIKNEDLKPIEQLVQLNVSNPQQETKSSINNQISNKTDDLKQEISSAKFENSANIAQNNQTDKKISDENAKTNVKSEETIDIKEDVSGIEFVENNKLDDEVQNKADIAEDSKEQVKQKVEHIKIQVEENIKINPQLQKNALNTDKTLKANETLEKAGLSTENLAKIDAKIKDIDTSANNTKSDLGQSSQEMIMRDIMQNNASNSNTEAVELKVDFNQSLNDKLQQSSLTQMSQPKDAQEVSILDQIRAKFAVNSQNGMQKITIGLTPESLGKLNIEISKGQNGISAQIIADNPQAKEILDKNLDGLKSVLQSQGVNVNNLNVKIAETGRSSDSNNNMFNQEDSQFDSNKNGGNSRNSNEDEKEKRSDFEFLQKKVINKEYSDESEEIVERTIQTEKTVSIKGGLGNVTYKM